MIALSVNLNKIALIRNSRPGNSPDLIEHAKICVNEGAHGITVHPRPDMRHIRPDDIKTLHRFCASQPGIEFNIEGNPFAAAKGDYPGFLSLVRSYRPDQCTLVPDTETQLTSDHGFDLCRSTDSLKVIINSLKADGIRVSLFMDADIDQISRAADIGANRIELYTGPFAETYQQYGNTSRSHQHYERYVHAAIHAHKLGLGINAGHDLNLENLLLFRQLPHLQEVSIGHALIIDAIRLGLPTTVRRYLAALKTDE